MHGPKSYFGPILHFALDGQRLARVAGLTSGARTIATPRPRHFPRSLTCGPRCQRYPLPRALGSAELQPPRGLRGVELGLASTVQIEPTGACGPSC
jgi:hypothetical protein